MISQRCYSPVRHLAFSLWPNHDPKRAYLGMYSAYFDASGNHDAKAKRASFYVCGFVASVEKWHKLETAWPELLAEYDMPQPFRMAEFMARNGKNPNAFTGWPGDETRQDAFRLAVLKLTHRWTNKPFAVGVVNEDLDRLFTEYDVPSDVPRNPYPWCSLRACELLFQWAMNRFQAGTVSGKESIQIVFEHGDYDQPTFANALWDKHQREVDFRTNHGKKFVPFAACDWLAWEFRNWMTQRERGMVELVKAYDYVETDTKQAAKKRAAIRLANHPIINEIARTLPNDALTCANWRALNELAERKGWQRRETA